MAKKDPLGIVVEDGFGTESLHKPPPEQDGEGNDFDPSDTTTATTSAIREPDPALDNVNINPHAGGDEHIAGVEQENINMGVHQTDVEAQTT
eukprot:9902909-Ditylum_brightwellii.AAC.1